MQPCWKGHEGSRKSCLTTPASLRAGQHTCLSQMHCQLKRATLPYLYCPDGHALVSWWSTDNTPV